MTINFSPNFDELIDMVEDWSKQPTILRSSLALEARTIFPTLISDDIERLVNALILGGAIADEVQDLLITIVSSTTANVLTISKILNLAARTGSPSTISAVNTNVNSVYGTVVLDQIATKAGTLINSALLTYTSKYSSIGASIGVAAAEQILNDLKNAILEINTLTTLL